LSCAQIKDCDVYESIYPVDRSNSEEPVREIHINPLRCPGGGSFNWDGKSKGGWQMEKGLYVFDITAKALSAGNYDSENIRSKYLKILQQTQQTPDGLREKPLIKLYADNPVRGLDQFEILYRLVDTGNIQPKEGKLYLYDPDLNVYEINQFFTLGPNSEMINTLKTTLDTDIDLLLPWGSYPKSGLYTFVLDFLDNHKDYKDHNPRFALPRGKKVIAPPPSVSLRAAYSFDVSAMVDSEAALGAISKAQELWDWRVGYIWQPYPPPGTEVLAESPWGYEPTNRFSLSGPSAPQNVADLLRWIPNGGYFRIDGVNYQRSAKPAIAQIIAHTYLVPYGESSSGTAFVFDTGLINPQTKNHIVVLLTSLPLRMQDEQGNWIPTDYYGDFWRPSWNQQGPVFEIDKINSRQLEGDLSHLLVVLAAGCYSINGENSIGQRIHSLGAKAVVGWRNTMAPYNVATVASDFWTLLAQGVDTDNGNVPFTVARAVDKLREKYREKIGDFWYIGDGSIRLYPPRYAFEDKNKRP
ncbi:MAG: hypothetical protein ACP5QS_07205, partial [bacterium]